MQISLNDIKQLLTDFMRGGGGGGGYESCNLLSFLKLLSCMIFISSFIFLSLKSCSLLGVGAHSDALI